MIQRRRMKAAVAGAAALALVGGSVSLGAAPAGLGATGSAADWAMLASLSTGTDYRRSECRDQSEAAIAAGQAGLAVDERRDDRCAAFKWWPIAIAAGALVTGVALAGGGGNGPAPLPPTPSPN